MEVFDHGDVKPPLEFDPRLAPFAPAHDAGQAFHAWRAEQDAIANAQVQGMAGDAAAAFRHVADHHVFGKARKHPAARGHGQRQPAGAAFLDLVTVGRIGGHDAYSSHLSQGQERHRQGRFHPMP